MNCADFESRVYDGFDASSLPQAADLAEHAAQCATCRATWEGMRLLSDCIGVWRQETPDVDLADPVIFALKHTAKLAPQISRVEARRPTISRQRLRRRSLVWAVAGAAALLIVLSLFLVPRPDAPGPKPVAQVPEVHRNSNTSQGDPRHQDLSAQDPVANDRLDRNEGSSPQVTQRHPPEPEADRVPYYDLAQRAAGALGQMTMLVLPVDAGAHHPPDEPPDEGPPAGWMDDFERELKPVGRSLGNAFDFLWRAGESVDG